MIKTAKFLVAAVLVGTVAGQAHAAANVVRYACAASQELTVQRDNSTAHVNLAGRTYDLRRKRSSVGDKYLSSNAALIIDGTSAIFVAANQLELGACIETVPLASR